MKKKKIKLPKYKLGGSLKDNMLAQSGANISTGMVYQGALDGINNLTGAIQGQGFNPLSLNQGLPQYMDGGNPDSETIQGQSHSNGGVPMTKDGVRTPNPDIEAEGGEKFITLSDHQKYILPKDSIESYMADKAQKKYSDTTDVTQTNALRLENDRLAKSNEKRKQIQEAYSSQLDSKIKDNLNKRYPNQQSAPQEAQMNPQEATQGLPEFSLGGFPGLPNNYPPGVQPMLNEDQYNLGQKPIGLQPLPQITPQVSPIDPINEDTQAGNNLLPTTTPPNFNKVADAIKGGVLGADLLKGALATADKVDPRLTDYSKSDMYMNNLTSDNTQAKQDVLASFNAGKQSIQNSSRSLPTQMALESNLYGNLGDSLGKLAHEKRMLDNQINSQLGQYESQKAQDEANKLFRADDLYARNKAAADSQRERALDTANNYAKDLSNKQYAYDAMDHQQILATLKTKEGFALMNHITENFGLSGEEEFIAFVQDPKNKELVEKARLNLNFRK